jgi:hypothetical protein
LKVILLAQLLAMPMEYVAAEERGYGLFGARQVSQKQKFNFGGMPARAEAKVRPASRGAAAPRYLPAGKAGPLQVLVPRGATLWAFHYYRWPMAVRRFLTRHLLFGLSRKEKID